MSQISVIIPVYNVESYLHRCVDSILEQTFSDFELILVDDGSPDNCGKICDDYAVKDGRVHVIHQKNGGLSAARNAGIDWVFANSDSQWLTFVDSDDWIHPQMLELLLHSALSHNVKVSVCSYVETNSKTPMTVVEAPSDEVWHPEDFFLANSVNAIIACGKLYSRDTFAAIRYPVGKIHEDEFTTYKILFAQKEIVVVPMRLYFYFKNESGITKSAWNPRRLDAVEAMNAQIVFYRKMGYRKAYVHTAVTLHGVITYQLLQIKESSMPEEEKRVYTRTLMKCLKKAAWRYADAYLKKDRDIFLVTFPAFAKACLRVKAVLRYLKNQEAK